MSEKYILPCSCGEGQLEVDQSQSGLKLNCPQCDEPLVVPTFRGLRQLQPVDGTSKAAVAAWGGFQAMLLIGGMLIALGFGWGGYRLATQWGKTVADHETFYDHFDGDTRLVNTWFQFETMLNERVDQVPVEVVNYVKIEHERERYYTYALLGVGAIGVICCGCAFVFFRGGDDKKKQSLARKAPASKAPASAGQA